LHLPLTYWTEEIIRLASMVEIEMPNYLPFKRVHPAVVTGPPSNTSIGRCMTRCSIESKKAGGNILSNLHMMIGMFSWILTTSSVLNVLEHKSLKN